MIKFNNVTKSFGAQVLFEELSFAVNRRERIGLVGRNGHGKTTLFRMVLGELAWDSGEIVIPKRYSVGYLQQHIAFTQPTVRDEACLGLPEERRDEAWRAEKILSGLGFSDDDMDRNPQLFSGGFQVRLNLAKVLVSEPDMLLLDEPTNYLDVVSIRWLANFLRSWPSEMMLITHDRGFMDHVVTHTVAIHRRRARKIEGDTEKIYDQILLEEEIYEKTRVNDDKKRKEIERFIERFRAKNSLATRVQSRIKFLEKHQRMDRLDNIQTLDFSFKSAPFPAKIMMRVENLSFAYKGGDQLLSNLSLEVQNGERICVIGQNGKGKTTLLRLLAGDLDPVEGSVSTHPKLETGYFAQTNVKSLNDRNNVVDEILQAHGSCLPQKARDIAGAMMFEGDAALKRISVLSGGEKSRVMLGKLCVTPYNLLLLDEPTNHLDMDSCDSMLAAVNNFDGAVIMVTHDENFLHTLATRFIVFDRGRVILWDRSYQDFLDRIGWEGDESNTIGGDRGARAFAEAARHTAALAPRSSGFEDAETVAAPTRTTPKPKPTVAVAPAAKTPQRSAPVDKKAARQARAKLLHEKSSVVGPLQERVRELETQINELEVETGKTLLALNTASSEGDAVGIAKYSRRHAQLKPEIDAAFEALEDATKKLETATRGFDQRLADVE